MKSLLVKKSGLTSQLLLAACLLAFPAAAQQPRVVVQHFLSGTGFFVNRDGYVLTNNHVVQNCKETTVEGPRYRIPAQIMARDEASDLALLKSNATPAAAAELRAENWPLAKGEPVVTVGFPGGQGITTREAQVVDPKGPQGEEKWLQFTDSVAKGNSGGPLLDAAANVVGVVVAKAQIYQYNIAAARRDFQRSADLAIALPVVRAFLNANGIRYREGTNGGILASHRVEDRAAEFIVHVECLQ